MPLAGPAWGKKIPERAVGCGVTREGQLAGEPQLLCSRYSHVLTPYMNSVPAIIAKASAIHNPIIYAITHPKYRCSPPPGPSPRSPDTSSWPWRPFNGAEMHHLSCLLYIHWVGASGSYE